MYIQRLREIIPPPRQQAVGVCNQINLPSLLYVGSSLVTLLNVIDAPTEVSDILVLNICFKFSKFTFCTFLLLFL